MKAFLLSLAAILIVLAGKQEFGRVSSQLAPVMVPAAAWLQPTPRPHGLPEVRLNASDYQAQDYFGYSVDVDGNLLAVGAPGVDEAGDESGAVYVFQHGAQGWSEKAKLMPGDIGPGDHLGTAVALDGETLAAGAAYATTPEAGFAAGVVYVFVHQGDNWHQQARLTARDGGAFDLFGAAIALDGDTLLVGARAADGPSGARNSGAAYVFHRQGEIWVEEARLSAADGLADDFFGHAVALQGDLAAVGAFGHDDPQVGPNAGAVYLFQRRNGVWYAQSELSSAQARPKAQFGYALQFAGSEAPAWLVVGANQYSSQAVDPRYTPPPGRLELFQWKGQVWQAAIQLEAEIDVNTGAGYFGSTLAMQPRSEDRLILTTAGLYSRNVNLYQITGQAFRPPLVIGPARVPINFGCSLAMSGTWLAVGSRWDSEPIPEGQMPTPEFASGAVYLYDLNGLK